ncbi:ribonuclease E activity regulator RraA [Pseudomonas sp. NPDC089758]|uniref:ribonuclease E activity regulator RraA n=1 Tax=Pseudomonas sp. NPDC089758 TaxID=3364473 RepID=UPI0037FB1F41
MSVSTADLCDRFAELIDSGQLAVLEGAWQWFGPLHTMSGRVQTLEARGCNVELRDLLKQPGKGHVLVIDSGGHRGALLGDNLASLARSNDWAGVLVSGNIRDISALASIDLAVVATGTWPVRSRNEPGGAVDMPLILGGVKVNPGHWIYADEDGVLISPHELSAA